MTMIDYFFALDIKKPWVFITEEAISRDDTLKKPLLLEIIPKNILLLELDAALMQGREGMYREFAAVMKFPDYFGNNYNALDDCMTDLQWLPADGYLLLIKNSEFLLSKEDDGVLKGLLSILDSAGEEWTKPVKLGDWWGNRDGLPFHTILELNKGKAAAFRERLKKINFDVENL